MTHLCCTACGLRLSRATAASAAPAPTCPACAQPLEALPSAAALGLRLFPTTDPGAEPAWPGALADALAHPLTPDRS